MTMDANRILSMGDQQENLLINICLCPVEVLFGLVLGHSEHKMKLKKE
jgi:hypothetical protein